MNPEIKDLQIKDLELKDLRTCSHVRPEVFGPGRIRPEGEARPPRRRTGVKTQVSVMMSHIIRGRERALQPAQSWHVSGHVPARRGGGGGGVSLRPPHIHTHTSNIPFFSV